jgi:hypothetical protein
MTQPMVRIHDLETDTVVDREMNNEEFAQYEADQAAIAEAQAEAATKAETRSALLERLGITEEEAVLLLGGN